MMKYYQVTFADMYDAGYHGVIPGLYLSREEAQKCADWYEKHPDPDKNFRCDVQELRIEDVRNEFVPTMSDEAYEQWVDSFFHPEYDLPDDYPPKDYPCEDCSQEYD